MKPILLLITAFAFSLCNLFAQQYDGIKLSTDKPEAGQKISFVYTGIFAKKINPQMTLYYECKGGINGGWKCLDIKHNGSQIEGSFTLPDSTLSFSLKPDNNLASKEIFIFNVFKNGKEAKGALIASAMLYTCGIYDNRNYKKAYDLYNQDFLKYPDLKPKNLLSYYQSVYRPKMFSPDPAIGDELEKTWADSLANGKSEQFLNRLAQLKMRAGNSSDPELIKKTVIAKYPNGDFAFSDDVKDLSIKIRSGDFATALTAIEIRYSAIVRAGGLDPIYFGLAQKQFVANNVAGAEDYLFKIQSNSEQKKLYLFASNLFLNNNRDLQKAEIFIQKAIALVKSDRQPYYVFDNKDWQKTLGGVRGDYLDISAQIQYHLGNRAEAINRLKAALQINDYNEKIKEHYLQYLFESDRVKEALAAASDYVIKEKETDVIKKVLQDAYIKDKGSATGYDTYYNGLLKESDKQYTIPEYSKFNALENDFTLKGIDGNMVSLSSFKGKTVVLYFFTSDFIDNQLSASIVGFNQFVKANKDENTVFFAINETAVSEADEANGRPLRIQKLNEYMAANKFSFKVLQDDFKPNPIPNRGNYYVVGDEYSANGGGQLYLIDKNGVVKYKSFVYTSLTRELTAALKLVK